MSQEVNADRVLQGEIERLTRRLRLPYVRSAAPELLKTARSQRWDPAEALRVLLEEEVAGRDKSGREARRQTAAFPHQKTFHTWREGASSIPLHVQHALRGLEWIERRENLVLCGASGAGKSHFLEALGQSAIDRDRRVVWFTLEDLGNLMRRHRIDDTNARAIKRINRADLICIDLWGARGYVELGSLVRAGGGGSRVRSTYLQRVLSQSVSLAGGVGRGSLVGARWSGKTWVRAWRLVSRSARA